ncbi:MAG: aminotransferase class IV [Myxococcota bacterium]|nr:aminotransferase class IV [Myxococcota bacterium]
MKEIADVDRLIWLDGEFVPWRDATVHVLSHSLQRGSLVFDFMSIKQTPRGGAIFRLDRHVKRLLRSCSLMGLPIAHDEAALSQAILETVRSNPGCRNVKISAFIPSVEVDVVPIDPSVSVAIAAYDPALDIQSRLPGERSAPVTALRVCLERDARQRREDIVSPEAKVSANYVSSMVAKARALKEGFHEILLMDEDGFLAEGPTSNVFVVDQDGALRTPPEQRVLRGVTRASVMELAGAMDIPLREEAISPDELSNSAEVFLTGTSASIMPVESLDGQKVGGSCPGPVTQRLRETFLEIERGENPSFEHWLTYIEEVPV